jgi:hypothetical protein
MQCAVYARLRKFAPIESDGGQGGGAGVAAAWLHGAYMPVVLRLSKMIPAELAIAAG